MSFFIEHIGTNDTIKEWMNRCTVHDTRMYESLHSAPSDCIFVFVRFIDPKEPGKHEIDLLRSIMMFDLRDSDSPLYNNMVFQEGFND